MTQRLLFVLLLWGFCFVPRVLAEEKTELLFVLLLTVVDADTFEVAAPLAIHGQDAQGRLTAVALQPVTKIRLLSVDAAETFRPQCAREKRYGELAKRAAQREIAFHAKRGQPVMIGLQDVKPDNFFRVDASILLPNNADLGDSLIRRGLAHRYPDRRGWCK